MSLSRQAARGSAITLASQAIRLILTLATTVVLSRLLAPSDFGLMAMVLAVAGVAQIFLDFGLSMAALQAKNLTQGQKSNLFWINAGVGAALAVLLFFLATPISWIYDEPRIIPLVQAISLFYLAGGITAQFRVQINRQLRFFALALTDIIPAALALAIAAWCAVAGFGLMSLAIQQLVIAFGTLIMAVALAKWFPGLPKRGEDMKPLLSFGVNFALTQLLSYATKNIDSVLIGRVWGAQALGQYDRAFQFSVVPIDRINAPLSKVAIPVLSRVSDERQQFLAWLRRAQLIACYLTSSLFLFVAGAAVPLVNLLLGPGWELAGQVLMVLAISGVFRSLSQISYWMFMAQGMAKQQLHRFLVTQPMIIAAMVIGLFWGPIGVAWGNVIGYAITWVISLLWAGRASQLNVGPLITDAIRTVLIFGLPAGLAAFAVSMFVPLPDIALVGIAFGAALCWFALAYLIFKPVRRDIALLLSFIRQALGGKS